MKAMSERLRRIPLLATATGRWTVGLLLLAAVCATLLWFGFAGNGDNPGAAATSMAPAAGDMVPPPEGDADNPALPEGSDSMPRDVIPPEEP